MKILRTLALSLLIAGLHVNAQPSEEGLIRQTLMDYIEGTANGQPERLRRAFHPDFNLYTVTAQDSLRIRDGERYISNIKEGQKNSRQGRILSIDYDKDAAVARVEIVIPGWRVFTDYFLLLKYEGSWKIVHKSYTSEPFSDKNGSIVSDEEIDQLFEPFNRNDHPAVAATMIYKGEVVYKKAFGSVALDQKVPASVHTKFQLGGLSKHFTAFAVLLLEEQGKLSLNDDIRTHLPELPNYQKTITIDHLLSMTSGLPDFWALKNIAGWHRDDVFTQDHAMTLIKNSQPGFDPGEDYIYSNTDILLLAEIVSKVSGQSFASFTKEHLFDPLGMTNTLVKDDFEQFIPNVATSYEADGDGFKYSALNYGIVGPTNVYSTVDDLAKWELNMSDPKVGSRELIDKLYTVCVMNNGNTMNPLFGTITYSQQLFHEERGIMEVYQTGTLGGYASSIFKFRDQEFTAIVLSSGIPYSGYLGMRTAYMFLEDEFTEPEQVDYAGESIKLKAKQLQQHTGMYWYERGGYSRSIELKNDTLRYVRGNGSESQLVPVSENEFLMITPGDERISVSFEGKKENKQMTFDIGESDPIISKRREPYSYSDENLRRLIGTYYCKPLNVVYEVAVEDGQLTASNIKAGKVTFKSIEKGLFEGDRWFFRSIRFDEDQDGFLLNTEEVRNLQFEKLQ